MGEVAIATLAAASKAIAIDLVYNPLRAVNIAKAGWINRTPLTARGALVDIAHWIFKGV